MTEYIKREYAVDAVADVYYNTPDINLSCEKFEAAILKIQAADVAPVVHAHWTGSNGTYCSHCERSYMDVADADSWESSDIPDFCPYCGAQMDEKEDR